MHTANYNRLTKTSYTNMDLLQRFTAHFKENNFAPAGKMVVLTVSGGMDSMVMAHLFLQAGLPFAIAHCNFKLRAGDADLDEALVRDWAEANGIAFHQTSFNTKEKSEEWKKGTQETARILRYEWFDSICGQHGYHRIATAHHANDNVETLLMNLFKGTGIAGLHGIRPHTDKLIRPLLFATREEIAQYASTQNVPYREDVSNASDNYLRNTVRHHLVPKAEELFPSAVARVNESIRRFADAEELYNRAIAAERKALIEQRGKDWYIPVRKLQHRTPLNTIVYELFTPFGYTSVQVPHLLQLLAAETGKYLDSDTHRTIRNRDFLIITEKVIAHTDMLLIEGVPCTVDTGTHKFHFSIVRKPATIPGGAHIACLDTKNIIFPLQLRKWHTGDYFYPLGMGMKKKKLSRFFIDQKLPLHEKEQVWVLECQKKIAWIAGMRLDERFKIREATETVLLIEMKSH